MGFSREARLLTKQGRQRGHQGLRQHADLQLGTRGPINCYPITKKAPCSSTTSSSWGPSPPLPPLRKRRENRRCRDCIIAPITVIIYTSILSYSLFFRSLLQSISPGRVRAAETCKEEHAVISEMTDFFFKNLSYFILCGKARGNSGAKSNVGTSRNEVSDPCGSV